MTSLALLLPDNATALERAVSLTGAARRPLPHELVSAAKNPATCPAELLPLLAYELSVDIWDDAWTVEKKRSIVMQAIRFHRMKGTLSGIKEYVRHSGGEILSLVRPPAKSFYSPHQSREEREEWLASLAELRLFDTAEPTAIPGRNFHGTTAAGGYRSFFADALGRGQIFCPPSTANERFGARAEFHDQGIETPVPRLNLDGSGTRIFLHGHAPWSVFAGLPAGDRFFLKSQAARRIVSISLEVSETNRELARFPVNASLDPVNAVPEMVMKKGVLLHSVFSGLPVSRRYYARTTANLRVFRSVRLFDPDRVPAGRKALSYWGAARLGLPPYWAELKTSIPGRRSRFAADLFISGFFVQSPRKKLEAVRAAVGAAKSARDKILLHTKTYRPLRAGTTLLVGSSLMLGRWTRS